MIDRDVQLDLKVLWDGHLARLVWTGKMPIPQSKLSSAMSRTFEAPQQFIHLFDFEGNVHIG